MLLPYDCLQSVILFGDLKLVLNWRLVNRKCLLLANTRLKTIKLNWINISEKKLSEAFIREFKDCVLWTYISEYQKLSEDFIREFKGKVHWGYISACQNLSEDFIREFKDQVVWYWISQHQKLSEDFIREFKLK